MNEWWTYRPSDFLMFAPRAYYRLFELHNTDVWPLHGLALGAGIAALVLLPRVPASPWRAAAALAVVAAACAGAGVFLAERLATIHWAGGQLAAAFGVQALLLAAAALRRVARADWRDESIVRSAAPAAVLLFALALFLPPALGVAEGRPWRQAELFGLAPDPTAIATLGVLAARPLRGGTALDRWLQRALWPLPLAWCAAAGMTLATMGAPHWPLLPAAALLALFVAWRDGARAARTVPGPTPRTVSRRS